MRTSQVAQTDCVVSLGDQTVEQLMDVMQVAQFSESTDRKPDLSDMKVGQACCAQYSIDKRWYRASVLRHIDDATVEVGSIAKCAVKMTYDLLSLSFSKNISQKHLIKLCLGPFVTKCIP